MTSQEVLQQIVTKLNSTDEVKAELRGWNKILQFNTKEGPAYFVIFNEDGSATLSAGTHSAPNVTLSAEDKILEDIFIGKLNGVKAAFSGQLRIGGDIFSAQKIVSILEKLK